MLKPCRVTKIKVFFLVLVYVFNFDLFDFGEGFISRRSPLLLVGKFPSLVQARNAITLQHLVNCQVVFYRRLLTKEKFKFFCFKSGRDRLQEVVPYKRFQI